MTNICIENRRALGDVVVLTATVRALHKCCPNQFRTTMQTTHSPVWSYNDLNSKSSDSCRTIRLNYGAAIKACNDHRGHFSGGFLYDLSQKLGVALQLDDIRPDLVLSPREENIAAIQAINEQLRCDKPYWVVMAGGKADMLAKMWCDDHWRAVATALQQDFDVVQVGSGSGYNARLDGVINCCGKTDIRQLFTLIRHSQGVICPVTCGAHIAAAFNKPAVVIAGGREPWWWETYCRQTWIDSCTTPFPDDFVEHTYLHCLGKRHCCLEKACWRSGLPRLSQKSGSGRCQDCVETPQGFRAACLVETTPAAVEAAVEHYSRGNTSAAPGSDFSRPDVGAALWQIDGFESEPAKRDVVPTTMRRLYGKKVRQARHMRRAALQIGKTGAAATAIGLSVQEKDINDIQLQPKTPEELKKDADVLKPVFKNLDIAVLLYGDYPDLAKKVLNSLTASLPPQLFRLRLGMNAVSAATHAAAMDIVTAAGLNYVVTRSNTNIYKYPMMREMISEVELPRDGWFIWFDDDSYVNKAYWITSLAAAIPKGGDMYGKKYFMRVAPGQLEWMRQSSWWRGVDFPKIGRRYKVDFATGGWWAIRNSVLLDLNWPDKRLQNNGGDTALGAACIQNGYVVQNYYEGIAISTHKRRGASQPHPGT